MLGFLNIMLVDAHSHVQDIKGFSPDKAVLPVVCGYSNSSNIKATELAKRFSLPFVLGIAPQTILKENQPNLEKWIDFIKKSNPNAIGEIGLDYHWAKNKEDIEKEKRVFNEMLTLADSLRLPIVIHSRKAIGDIFQIIKERDFSKPIMFHFYSGNIEEAKKAISLGGLISFTPLHSKERRSIINTIALEHILVETDAPFVCRHPSEVADAVNYISEVKKLDYDIVANQTTKNAMNFFRINL